MKKNVLFDTSCGSLNMGDYIICESVERELKEILGNDFLVRIATHTPVTHFYQNSSANPIYNYCEKADYKFLAGTNILQYQMFLKRWPNFNVNLFNYMPYKDTILVGAGSGKNKEKMDMYTKYLYKRIFSKDYIHSTRDRRTKELLESLGLRAIDTGCATMWCLTEKHCKSIPHSKAESVVFTLTDYKKDAINDLKLLDCLRKNYKEIFFWPQGSGDYEYLNELTHIDDLLIVPPSVFEFRKLLEEHKDIDYIGTRLHAGIYAMQHQIRSIILIVDNRTSDMMESYNINAIIRDDVQALEDTINSSFETLINIDEEKIKKWKAQFEDRP